MKMNTTTAQEQYHRDGFAIVRAFFNPGEVVANVLARGTRKAGEVAKAGQP